MSHFTFLFVLAPQSHWQKPSTGSVPPHHSCCGSSQTYAEYTSFQSGPLPPPNPSPSPSPLRGETNISAVQGDSCPVQTHVDVTCTAIESGVDLLPGAVVEDQFPSMLPRLFGVKGHCGLHAGIHSQGRCGGGHRVWSMGRQVSMGMWWINVHACAWMDMQHACTCMGSNNSHFSVQGKFGVTISDISHQDCSCGRVLNTGKQISFQEEEDGGGGAGVP